tara:strand:- start:755 stop:1381 length:627 start_codon:yes stop_codon:yes gene_type:complete
LYIIVSDLSLILKEGNKLIRHILLILSLLICGCSDQVVNNQCCQYDEELIQSIRNSSDKLQVEVDDLPLDTQTTLQDSYSNNLIIQSMSAPNLGYEISLGSTDNSMGEIDQIYFNTEGRRLRSEREDYEERRECFELGYPLNWSMPDGTNISVENENDWEEVRAWYEQNPDVDQRYIQYPVNIIYEDGTSISVENEEDLIQAYEECGA